jgi:predicted GNAT superfamily acetyltransferase
MTVQIRPIQTHEEYRAVEQLQREVWGLPEVDIVPDHLLLTAQKNGGLVLGAFDTPPGLESQQLVGFVFGFPGLLPDGRVKHCSHMAGVAPAYQNRNVGYLLKLAQRDHVLAQGLDLITWTFDPLESRNAYLNFHKLGVTCRTYLRELYGRMRDGLNLSLPSDRFQVDWHIASAHVAGRLGGARTAPSSPITSGGRPTPPAPLPRREGGELLPSPCRGGAGGEVRPTLAGLQGAGVPVLNRPLAGDPPRPAQRSLPIEGECLLVQIPAHFQALKAADIELALAWRLHTRALFEAAFGAGYVATDLLFEGGQSCYLLEKDWAP